MRVLVTGCYGFIGSHFCQYVLNADPRAYVIGFARNSDQGNRARLYRQERLNIVYGDLCDANALSGICEGIDVVVNFAAKTFVDHSLKDSGPFIQSNIIGADNIMADATRYGVKRFIQVSTDEVYGEILHGSYREDAMLQPRNPYAWTKACADLNAIQRHRTYGFPCIITRTENNFGPFQHRQKALPTFVRAAMRGDPLPIYGDGEHVRCWLYVNEHCRVIHELISKGKVGQIYHVAGEQEMTNNQLANLVLDTLGRPRTQVKYIPDHNIRPGHDRRYALDCSKLRAAGVTIEQDLPALMKKTIEWYAERPRWGE